MFVCDNLAFTADHVIRRKHTAHAKRDLPGLVAEVVEPLSDAREQQHRMIEHFKETPITERLADHAIMAMYREGIINVQRIAEVSEAWEHPAHEAFAPRTAWSLFNAATSALAGRVVDNPGATEKLHRVVDGVCELAS